MKTPEEPEPNNPKDSSKYDKFLNLPCRNSRRHVFHGVKEENNIMKIVCLSCGDEYEFIMDGRNRIEKSLWDTFEKYQEKINLEPLIKKVERKQKIINLVIKAIIKFITEHKRLTVILFIILIISFLIMQIL